MRKQYCYTLLDKNGALLYIGRTDDVAKRMRGHADIIGAKTIMLTECANEYEVKYVEAALINRYKPPYNSIIPTVDKVASHLRELAVRYPDSQYVRQDNPDEFPVDYKMPLSELNEWSRKHVSTKHQIAVYLDDYEYKILRQYCNGRTMAGVIKDILDREIICRARKVSMGE